MDAVKQAMTVVSTPHGEETVIALMGNDGHLEP
jgi:hypothetical protein